MGVRQMHQVVEQPGVWFDDDVSPVCSQEGLLWRVHNPLNSLYCAAYTAMDRAWREAPALYSSCSRAVRSHRFHL